MIGLAAAFVVGPMLATLIAGLRSDLARLLGEPISGARRPPAWSWRRLLPDLPRCSRFAWRRRVAALAEADAGRARRLLAELADTGAGLVLVVPPVVDRRRLVHPGSARLGDRCSVLAPAMVVAVNAVMAMPFSLDAIRPAYDAAGDRYDRLCRRTRHGRASTGWRLVDWPVLGRPLATGFAFAMALSLGDLGVIALFGSESVQTLPYLLLWRLGSLPHRGCGRTGDAARPALPGLDGVLRPARQHAGAEEDAG